MNKLQRLRPGILLLMVAALVIMTGLALWSSHTESIEATHSIPMPPAVPVQDSVANPDVTPLVEIAATSLPSVSVFHSKTIDAHLAQLEAARIAAEKAAAEKAEAERLAAEKAAAEKAAAEAAAAAAAAAATPVVEPAPPPKKQFEIIYRGMMDRVDGTLLAFIENRTEGTTFYYQAGEAFLHGTLQSIQPRSITLKLGDGTQDITVNQPTIIVEP